MTSQREKISSASDIAAGVEAEAEQKKNVDITLKNDERLRYEKKLTQYIEGLSNIVVKKEDAFASVILFYKHTFHIIYRYYNKKPKYLFFRSQSSFQSIYPFRQFI